MLSSPTRTALDTRLVSTASMEVLIILLFIGNVFAVASEEYPYSLQLKPNGEYDVFWKFDDEMITFELNVKTRGWVGFGLSPDGGMEEADIIIGWIKDGVATLTDRFSVEMLEPTIDVSQDWVLLSGYETSTHTILKVTRPLRSCDLNDRNVTEDTMRLIWAYNDEDPGDDGSLQGHLHTAEDRGSRSVQLIGALVTPPELPDDARTLDLTIDSVTVPAIDTYYGCRGIKLPELTQKQHIIKMAPLIQQGNEALVHHIVLYGCYREINDTWNGHTGQCYTTDMTEFSDCQSVIGAWAIGGPDIYLPEHVGIPIGVDTAPKYVLLEMHYDNFEVKDDWVDSSGIRLWITPTLRTYDSSSLMMGMRTDYNLLIPPNMEAFRTDGHCPNTCLNQAFGSEGIKAFAALLHSHTLGVTIKLRHFRNGIELPVILGDNNYDFNYQENKILREEVVIRPTDNLVLECTYDSTSRTRFTVGGLRTQNEMCLAFIQYYPQIALTSCQSNPAPSFLSSVIPGADLSFQEIDNLNLMDWTNPTLQTTFQDAYLSEPIMIVCTQQNGEVSFTEISVPAITQPLVVEEPACYKPDTRETVVPSEDYPLRAELKPNNAYTIFWRFDDNDIILELHVRTNGWVGFGLSPNGGMEYADFLIGWVKDGIPTVTDRYTEEMELPAMDESQDWRLILGYETDSYTVLKVARALRSCDPWDRNITADTIRVIWASHPEDPDDTGFLKGHEHTLDDRGTRSIQLLNYETRRPEIPDDSTYIDVLQQQILLPPVDTYYACRGFLLPEMNEKQHIVMVEPIMEAGNEVFVHHIILYACYSDLNETLDGLTGQCYTEEMTDFWECGTPLTAWGVGGTELYLPEHVGIPLGTSDSPKFLLMETHYDNFELRDDVVDSSGLRLWVTPTLRQFDSATFISGVTVKYTHVIPPRAPRFRTDGHCTQECLADALASQPEGIQVFAVLLHTHLLGVSIKLRHFREGKELPLILEDLTFDFDYQDFRFLQEEVTILETDNLIVECTYDSQSRTDVTMGGLGTQSEMCLAFIQYYPKIALAQCSSLPEPNFLSQLRPGAVLTADYISELNQMDWTSSVLQADFQEAYTTAPIDILCKALETQFYPSSFETVNVPEIKELLVMEEPVCYDSIAANSLIESESYPFSVDLLPDGRYRVFWKFDEETLTLEVHVKTRGWVGLGLSPDGGMEQADIMIGWVKDGQAIITDRFATEMELPTLDSSQDWKLISGYETDAFTVLKIERPLRSCDARDRNITMDTTRLIWALHAEDPAEDGSIKGHLHTQNERGSKSVLLLNHVDKRRQLPSDAFSIDVLNDNFAVPAFGTYYVCRGVLLPSLPQKHHVVMVEPVVEEGHEALVHHIILYACYHEINESYDGHTGQCYTSEMTEFWDCETVLAAWAIGGMPFYFPDHVGFPLGTKRSPKFVMMEIHLDNPLLRDDYVDSSGMRMWVSATIREFDSATVMTGAQINYEHLIPPQAPAFRTDGHCLHSCLSDAFGSQPEGIKVFSVLLHTHVLGQKVRVRHLRNGRELPIILEDSNYDFNYQETKILPEEVTILPTDNLVVECVYDSTERQEFTVGGLGTRNEMCLAFLQYYPEVPLARCLSNPAPSFLSALIPGAQFREDSIEDLNGMDWSNSTLQHAFQEAYTSGEINSICRTLDSRNYPSNGATVGVPSVAEPLVVQEPECYIPPQAYDFGTKDYFGELELLPEGDFSLFWRFTEELIEFEIHAKTRGWVGLGLSPEGGMEEADIIIGWVKDGIATVTDRYATDMAEPTIDSSQDWVLIRGYETDTHTVLHIYRSLRSCDPMDRNITSDTLRLIWAFHHNDPDDEGNIQGHLHSGSNRGSRSIQLLNYQTDTPNMPNDAIFIDLINDKVALPPVDTFYPCRGFLLPDLPTKHHIVKFEPVISTKDEALIRHMIIYACYHDINETEIGEMGQCFHASTRAFADCTTPVYIWGVGAKEFYLPEHIGIPVGTGRLPRFLFLEVQAYNPELRTGYLDSAGVRMWLTPTLRRYDAASFIAGVTFGVSHLIPPGMTAFRTDGTCSRQCLSGAFGSRSEGIKVLAVMVHTLLAGSQVKLRHFRNGKELPPLIDDRSYTIDYKATRYLDQEVNVLPTDDLRLECTYNTIGRSKFTKGGLGMEDEQCLASLLYYPEVALGWCTSLPTLDYMSSIIPGAEPAEPYTVTNTLGDIILMSPEQYSGWNYVDVLNRMDWTNATLQRVFQEAYTSGPVMVTCTTLDNKFYPSSFQAIPVPVVQEPFVAETPVCHGPSDYTAASPSLHDTRAPPLALLVLVLLGRLL